MENENPTPSAPKKESRLRRVWFFFKFLEIRLRFIAVLVITALFVGYWDHVQNYYERWQREHYAMQAGPAQTAEGESDVEYFCGMHPFVVRDHPGEKCPICGMDLTARKKGAPTVLPEGAIARVQASPERIMQAGVETEPVLYRMLTRTLRSYGAVEADEARMARIIARFPGRIEELMVNTTGAPVKKGEALARIYSPEYLAASEEYVRSLANQQKAGVTNAEIKNLAEQVAEGARRRLLRAGFTKDQLDAIAKSGAVSDSITLYAPIAGTVIEKTALSGEAVEEGTALFTVADLSVLWVQVKVPEADLGMVRQGMPVEITAVAYPGTIFYGNIGLVYPQFDTESRTVKVRVTVPNTDGRLKPAMYVNAVIRAPYGKFEHADETAPGPAAQPAGNLALPTATKEHYDAFMKTVPAGGEYHGCTMCDTVASNAPGTCPLCKMDLTKMLKGGGAAPIEQPTKEQTDADKLLAALEPGADYYECAMHPNVRSTQPGACPLCNMTLDRKTKAAAPGQSLAETGSTEPTAIGYACEMHPNELSDQPGTCRTCNCGMLMKKWKAERVLAVPETAVIDTGERKVVYVETMPGVYDAHAIQVGPRLGQFYPVLDGLTLNQKIVTRGAFLIDAEARLNPVAVQTNKP